MARLDGTERPRVGAPTDVSEPDPAAEPVDVDGGRPVESLLRVAARFSWVILLSMLAALMLQLWIVRFLSWIGPGALYVQSIYAPIGFLVLAITEGLAVVTQVTAGIASRTQSPARALRLTPTFLAVGVGLLGVVALGFAVVSPQVLDLLKVPTEERPEIVGFALSTVAAAAAGLAPVIGGAVLRGVGAVRTSSLLAGTYAVLAALSIAAFHLVGDAGIYSVPLGTLLASVVVGVATAFALRRAGVEPPRWTMLREGMRMISSIAVPVGATFLLLSVVALGYLRVLRNADPVEIAGFGVGQTAVFSFTVLAIACGSGAAIAVNLRPGEDRTAVDLAGFSTLLRIVLPAYVALAVVAFVVRRPFAHLLAQDPAVAEVTIDYFTWVAPTLMLFGGTLAMLTFMEQIGRARSAFLLNLVYFAIVLGVAFSLPQPVRASTMAQLIAVGNTAGFATLLVSVRYLLRRRTPAPAAT